MALMKMPSVMVSEIKSITFSPDPIGKITAQMHRNMKGVPFRVYEGEERVTSD